MQKELLRTNAPSVRTVRALGADTRGAGLVEYIILVGLIALLAIAGFETFGTAVNEKAIELGEGVTGIGGGS
jgi:Flp pilus assembly pilin Flp